MNFDDSFWPKFQAYLLTCNNTSTSKIRLLYAKRYYHVLKDADAKDILTLSTEKRKNVMKSLALLSKYLGCYNRWKDIRERYQLKWSSGDSLEAFSSMFSNEQNYTSMVSWLKDSCSRLPKQYSSILLFNTLTGLRPDEACKSISLIHKEPENYIKQDKTMLEHYKYPATFIRRTKKAYISILTEQILETAKQSTDCGYNALSLSLKRRKIPVRIKYCRKIFATYLRQQGIESELIDLLQGRTPKTTFVRHYWRPSFDKELERIRQCVLGLHDEIRS